jgi:hypothetical protein
MIRYMSLEEQVDKDFERVRQKAFLRRMRAWLRKDVCSDLSTLVRGGEEGTRGVHPGVTGIRAVPVEKIVGSVGRTRDFDGAFLPTWARAATRWKRVDWAFYGAWDLPPVRLFKVGDEYFVEDGNHRVSVVRYQGVEMIDAEVVELLARIPRQNR